MADTQLLPEDDQQTAGRDDAARTPEELEDLGAAPALGEGVDIDEGIREAENHANQKSAGIQSILKKKKGWVFGGGIAGLIVAAIFGVLSLLPLKLEHMIKNIMAKNFDRVEYAM